MDSNNSLIQWPKAMYWQHPWNPIIGCKPCSPACDNCYARAWAQRFGQSFEPHLSSRQKPPRTGVVFCGNMTDLFGEWMWPWFGSHDGYIVRSPADLIIEANSEKAIYLWLTKRVDEMAVCLTTKKVMFDCGECFSERNLCNHYFGFTAENQEWYDRRFTEFKKIPTVFKGWLSAEPLLGPIDLGLDKVYPPEAAPFQWVVVGCESGPNRRPCKIEWVESIVEQCLAANVPVFVKQIVLPNGKFTNKIDDFPEHLRIRQMPWLGK